MMRIILAALIGICSADVSHLQGSAYLPPHVSNGASGAYQSGYSSRSQDANAHILRQSNDVNDRSFAYDFETSNGIKAHQNGQANNGVQSQGAFSYKGDDGHDYSITYTADENGYRPQGAHLPTPPPVPEAILRSLQYIRANPSASDNSGSYQASQSSSGQYSPPRQTGFNTQTGYHY